MKIQVMADDGTTAFEYDTAKNGCCVYPGISEKPSVITAMTEASALLGSDVPTIQTIRDDIQAIVWRIESELGAHPAFTWAQTTLKYAREHLEHYLKGVWTEPPVVPGITIDNRGIIIAAPPLPPPAKND